MKVVLISPYGSLVGVGLRVLSACLSQAGYDVCMIFLPSARETSSFLLFDPSELYDEGIIEQVGDLCADAGLVGITVMTNYFYKAKQLTETLRERLRVPIVWGGIHPTVRPEECLEHADIVCVGEGDQALVELADRIAEGKSYDDVANLGYKSAGGRVIVNPLRPLIHYLDALPFPDFGPDNHYVLHEGRIRPLTPALIRFYLMAASATGEPVYPLLATRGCPHRCNYCANDSYANLYQGWRHVRRRSNASLVAEIRTFRERFPFVGEIALLDDVFVAAPTRTIVDFARLYREEVGLPFYCIVSPLTINEPKLSALLDAGLVRVSMGIQSGSERVQKLYNRPIDNKTILKATRLVHKYADSMLPPIYDVITDNPYEETQDQLETLELLQRIPPPYKLLMFSLVFYPGTALYKRARADGLIKDEGEEIYNRNYFKLQPTFYNLVIYGFHRRFPRWLLCLTSHKLVFRLLNTSRLRPFWRFGDWCLMRARIWYNRRRLRRFRAHPARPGEKVAGSV
jgi:anaerobic magnesium-protoporphyrin IX monomethyl ester cyclase